MSRLPHPQQGYASTVQSNTQIAIALIVTIVVLAPKGSCGVRRDNESAWLAFSSSGNCVFAFVPKETVAEPMPWPNVSEEQTRFNYATTGLYTTEIPPRLLWELPIDVMSPPVYVSDDMVTVVIPGSFVELPFPLPEDFIATFVDRGVIASQVRYSDISSLLPIKRLLTSGGIICVTRSRFDPVTNHYVVETNVGEQIILNARTGVVEQYQDPVAAAFFNLTGVLCLTLLGFLCWWIRHRKPRHSPR